MNNLYGIEFVEKQRKAGFKSTVYAMAEIVDNSIDAGAENIDLIMVEKKSTRGAHSRDVLSEIFFIDDGCGMGEDLLNGCLTFSEGKGRADKRIGAFGVGLPNSSISVGRRVEVYSRDEDNVWRYVFLDLDDQKSREKPGYDNAVSKNPTFNIPYDISPSVRTIVRWSKLDLIDVATAKKLIERSEKLLGRIYRYALKANLSINLGSCIIGNSQMSQKLKSILIYDPLFITEEENFITKSIWDSSKGGAKVLKHPVLGHIKEFNSQYHYAKFIEGHIENKTSKAIFQTFDDYHDVTYETKIGGKRYAWKIRASFAYKSISKPGIRNGGQTEIGKILGEKMSGRAHFKSGNIYFIRANREIDYGHFGLYTVTDEKNRFWTIEIHFDSDLDDLMGVSNTKQSVDFYVTQNINVTNTERDEAIAEGIKREILYSEITTTVSRAIDSMRKQLAVYARQFKSEEKAALAAFDDNDQSTPIPQIENVVFEVIPKGDEEWPESKKVDVVKFLKNKYMHLPIEVVKAQVETYSKGLTKTVVIYAPNEANILFELVEKRGVEITIVNTNHIYYKNIIEPLKDNRQLKVFAIAIELLLSSFALEMNNLKITNKEKYSHTLDTYLVLLSSRLNEFIHDSKIKVRPDELIENVVEKT